MEDFFATSQRPVASTCFVCYFLGIPSLSFVPIIALCNSRVLLGDLQPRIDMSSHSIWLSESLSRLSTIELCYNVPRRNGFLITMSGSTSPMRNLIKAMHQFSVYCVCATLVSRLLRFVLCALAGSKTGEEHVMKRRTRSRELPRHLWVLYLHDCWSIPCYQIRNPKVKGVD